LLNDSEIRGAKWILININSSRGEHEFTMDEVEVIQNYLLTQAGEGTDVILGMGYDDTLGDRIGITLIATGFEHKDPFAKPTPKKEEPKPEEKIVMVLGKSEEEKPAPAISTLSPAAVEKEMEMMEEEVKALPEDYLMPKLVEEIPVMHVPVIDMTDIREEQPVIIHWELQPEAQETPVTTEKLLSNNTSNSIGITTVDKKTVSLKTDSINSVQQINETVPQAIKETDAELIFSMKDSSAVSAASGGYLARPSNIYAEAKTGAITPTTSVEEPVPSAKTSASNEEEELLELQMQVVERDDIPAADMPLAHQAQTPLSTEVEDPAMLDETEEQKRRAAERLHKLRNLSFNINAADPNNEFETVPAYIRRNMELYNSNNHIENFYSSYEVKSDEKNQGHISTINTFLDGKKPD
jgi:cell division protein FtsZ